MLILFILVILFLNLLNQQLEISVRCTNLIKDNACFKNPDKPSCIDLIITNGPKCFQNSVTLETGLSDFHKMTLTVIKSILQKKDQSLSDTAAIKGFLKRCLWPMFRKENLKWPLKTTSLSLIFWKQYLMKLFKNTL